MPQLATDISNTKKREELIFQECKLHTDKGFDETEKRTTGKNRIGSISFNEADELFRSWLDENKWPYDALLFDLVSLLSYSKKLLDLSPINQKVN